MPESEQLTLSVVDQSPIRRDGTAAEALRETVQLAQVAERLGYARYWVAEHHNAPAFAGTSPEVLIGQIAAATRTIRVGSGGVMLSHYASLKVAEQFRILDAFYPGRIDLGIGRAPGSDQLTAAALAYPRQQVDIRQFSRQVVDLIGYLHGTIEESHPFREIRAQPGPLPESAPEVWLLGSSDYSAQLAAHLGLPFAFADFFGDTRHLGPAMADLYRHEFTPSRFLSEPKVNVTLHVVCAPTEAEARRLGASRRLNRAAHVLGFNGLLPAEEAAAYPLPDDLQAYVERSGRASIEGDPEQVRARVLEMAKLYCTTDLGIVTNCYHFADRVRSYEMVAELFGLRPPA